MTPEANAYSVDEGTTYTKELETNKKRKMPDQNTPITWKRNVSPHSQKNYLREGGVYYKFDKSASAFDIYEQFIILDVLIELFAQQSNLYLQQNRRNFLINAEEIKAFIGVNYIMTVNKLPSIPMYWDCNHFVGNVSSQALIDTLFEDGTYAVGAARSNRKQMSELKEDRNIFRGESDFHYSKNIIYRK